MNNIIAMMTDFSTNDTYVGVMKGVIKSINPKSDIVDLTHHIEPQNIKQASFLLKNAWNYFPETTVFLCVVDPGVGTSRTSIIAEINNRFFVGPNNGILTDLLQKFDDIIIHKIENNDYYLENVSKTFHGRDIFAPVAAHLNKGVIPSKFGSRIHTKDIVLGENPILKIADNYIDAEIIHTDYFGNLITTIDKETLSKHPMSDKQIKISVNNYNIYGIFDTYGSAQRKQLVSYIGSDGYLEIAVNKGNAKNMIYARTGDKVKLTFY